MKDSLGLLKMISKLRLLEALALPTLLKGSWVVLKEPMPLKPLTELETDLGKILQNSASLSLKRMMTSLKRGTG